MACFTPELLKWFLIWLVVVIVAIAIVKAVFPALMEAVGAPPDGAIVMTVLGYLIWAAVAIMTIVIVFDLIGCLIGGPSGLSFPLRGAR